MQDYEPPQGNLASALDKDLGGVEGLKKIFNPAAAALQVTGFLIIFCLWFVWHIITVHGSAQNSNLQIIGIKCTFSALGLNVIWTRTEL